MLIQQSQNANQAQLMNMNLTGGLTQTNKQMLYQKKNTKNQMGHIF